MDSLGQFKVHISYVPDPISCLLFKKRNYENDKMIKMKNDKNDKMKKMISFFHFFHLSIEKMINDKNDIIFCLSFFIIFMKMIDHLSFFSFIN